MNPRIRRFIEESNSARMSPMGQHRAAQTLRRQNESVSLRSRCAWFSTAANAWSPRWPSARRKTVPSFLCVAASLRFMHRSGLRQRLAGLAVPLVFALVQLACLHHSPAPAALNRPETGSPEIKKVVDGISLIQGLPPKSGERRA
jgi:hypothetical protein